MDNTLDFLSISLVAPPLFFSSIFKIYLLLNDVRVTPPKTRGKNSKFAVENLTNANYLSLKINIPGDVT